MKYNWSPAVFLVLRSGGKGGKRQCKIFKDVVEGISIMRQNGVVWTGLSVQTFSSFLCYFQFRLAIISKKKKNKKRELLKKSLKGNEQFQIPNSSFLCIFGEKYTGFALSCKYITWFWVTVSKWKLKTTTSQSKLLFSPHCTTCGFSLQKKKRI